MNLRIRILCVSPCYLYTLLENLGLGGFSQKCQSPHKIQNFSSLSKYILSLPVRFPKKIVSAFLSAIVFPAPNDHTVEILLIYCTNYKRDTSQTRNKSDTGLKYALLMDFENRDSLSKLDTLCLAPVTQLSHWSRLVSSSICSYIWTLQTNFLIQGWSFYCALKQNILKEIWWWLFPDDPGVKMSMAERPNSECETQIVNMRLPPFLIGVRQSCWSFCWCWPNTLEENFTGCKSNYSHWPRSPEAQRPASRPCVRRLWRLWGRSTRRTLIARCKQTLSWSSSTRWWWWCPRWFTFHKTPSTGNWRGRTGFYPFFRLTMRMETSDLAPYLLL